MGPPPCQRRTRWSQWRDGARVSASVGCSRRAVGTVHIRGSCSCRASARRADLIGRKRVSTRRTWLLQVCYMQCTPGPPRAGTRALWHSGPLCPTEKRPPGIRRTRFLAATLELSSEILRRASFHLCSHGEQDVLLQHRVPAGPDTRLVRGDGQHAHILRKRGIASDLRLIEGAA